MKLDLATRPLTESELFMLIINACDYYKHAMILALASGLRISDLIRLEKAFPIPSFSMIEQKTSKRITIHLPSWSINSWLYFVKHSTHDIWLLDRRDKSSYRKYIKRLALSLGIDSSRVAWHSLRKSSADVIAKKYGLVNAQMFLNHKKIDSTLRYVNFDNNILENCFLSLQGVLK